MKIVFVSSGNRGVINPLIKAQGISLCELGHQVYYFLIKGKGILGYVSNIWRLKKFLKTRDYDIIHAHFSYSGYVAVLAGGKPIVLSLMGSDVKSKWYSKYIIRLISGFFLKGVIVKSPEMKKILKLSRVEIIPNGVNIEIFRPLSKETAFEKLGWDTKSIHILFASNPNRPEKNYELAKKAINYIRKERKVQVHYLNNIHHSLIPYYMNASQVVILTSLWEGSPNVIKEAMSCNRPVVCTDVGDVRSMFDNLDGCYVSGFTVNSVVEKLNLALDYSSKFWSTKARSRIKSLNLDSYSVAKKIERIYYNIKSA